MNEQVFRKFWTFGPREPRFNPNIVGGWGAWVRKRAERFVRVRISTGGVSTLASPRWAEKEEVIRELPQPSPKREAAQGRRTVVSLAKRCSKYLLCHFLAEGL